MSTVSKVLCANNAVGTLEGLHSASTTTLTLSGTQGNKFPVIDNGNCFYATIENTLGDLEIVLVTGRVGSTFTVVRGQSGTTAFEWASGTEVSLRATAELFNDKVDWKQYTADLANKIDKAGGTTITGALSFQNSATITVSDGTNSQSFVIPPTGFPTINGVSIALLPYPVGSTYCTTVSTNPATLLGGGTWVRIGEGKCLIDAGSTYTAGSTGGSATHTITTEEMPSHTHTGTTADAGVHNHTRGSMNITGGFGGLQTEYNNPTRYYSGAFSATTYSGHTDGSNGSDTCVRVTFNAANGWSGNTSSDGTHSHTVNVSSAGGGSAVNIMNPYLAVYMWKRTA